MAARSYVTARMPAHYLLKIENVSKLIYASVDDTNESGMYESALFEAGGYKWSLVVYPNGDARKNIRGFLSLYLKLHRDSTCNTDHDGLIVEADFKFFVFNQMQNIYTVYYEEGNGPRFKRFSSVTPILGIDVVMNTIILQHEPCGYTVKNACIIGAEILVSSGPKSETLRLVDIKRDQLLKWSIQNYLGRRDEVIYSPVKNVEGWEWKMELYPNGKDVLGDPGTEGSFASLYLTLVNTDRLRNKQKVYADVVLKILEQRQNNHIIKQVKWWFSAEDCSFRFDRMIERGKLFQTSDGFVMNDGVLNLQAEFRLVSVVQSGLTSGGTCRG